MDADPKGLLYSRDQASKGTFSIFWVPVYMSDSPLCFHCFHWSTRRILSQYTSQEKLKVLEKLKHRFWSTSRWPQFFYQTQVHSLPCLPIQSVGDHVEFCWIFFWKVKVITRFSLSCYMGLSKLLNFVEFFLNSLSYYKVFSKLLHGFVKIVKWICQN